MGLFYRREQPQTEVLYTVGYGLEQAKLIVGLGNIGLQYAATRHNLGFMCVDEFVHAESGDWSEKKQLKSYVSELRLGQSRVIVIKPTTLMNYSGEAVQAVQHFYKIVNEATVVVHDELDVPFGQIRVRKGGRAAGNKGIKSVITHCGEDFYRVRAGIKNEQLKQMDSADFVLQKFSKEEAEKVDAVRRETAVILNEFVYGGELSAETRSLF